MGAALSNGARPNIAQNHASSGAWQHNGDAYIGNTFNFNAGRDDELLRVVDRIEKAVLSDEDNNPALARAIIASLAFPEMPARRQTIDDAAYKTFEWLLKDLDSDNDIYAHDLPRQWITEGNIFKTWLEHSYDTDLFWVSGKAGSGKSTFMKYVCDHWNTCNILQKWAGDRRLCTSFHFFWHTGSPLQKSRQGLLQSILRQVCEFDNSFVPILFPRRWRQYQNSVARPWSTAELLDALHCLQQIQHTAFCVFVDGLDEFHPADDHYEVARELLCLAATPNVKVCVSSRPWEAFRSSFRNQIPHQSIAMDLLTRRDLYEFASTRMRSVRRGSNLRDYDFDTVAKTIVKKAEGVFLWVRLVMIRVCDRIQVGFDREKLMQYLDEFPAELGPYMKGMIYERISPTWKGAETARCLKLAMLLNASKAPEAKQLLLYLIILSLETVDAAYISDMGIQFVDDTKLQNTKRVVESSCEGLLAVSNDAVDFTHRTVYDFLLTTEMQELVDASVPGWFTCPSFIDRLLLARCRFVYGDSEDLAYPQQHRVIWSVFQYLERASRGNEHNRMSSLELAVLNLDQEIPLPQITFEVQDLRPDWPKDPVSKIMMGLMRYGLYEYVRQTVSVQPQLSWGLDPIFPGDFTLATLPILHDMISFLICSGLDARTLANSWRRFLGQHSRYVPQSDRDRITRLLLDEGVGHEQLRNDQKVTGSAETSDGRHQSTDLAIELAHQRRIAFRAKFWPQFRHDGVGSVFLVWCPCYFCSSEVFTICPTDEVLHTLPEEGKAHVFDDTRFKVSRGRKSSHFQSEVGVDSYTGRDTCQLRDVPGWATKYVGFEWQPLGVTHFWQGRSKEDSHRSRSDSSYSDSLDSLAS